MTTQFRDTQFGHLVRFLSRTKLFRYPDENDPSLWEKSVVEDSEKPQGLNNSINASAGNPDTENVDSPASDINHVIEDGKGIFQVDWYNPDDPEVSTPHYHPVTTYLIRDAESSELAQHLEAAGVFSNLPGQLFNLHPELDLCSRRTGYHARL